MKNILDQQHPKVHLNYKKLKAALLEAWNIIINNKIRYLIRTEIKTRYQTIINADRKKTKY